MLSFSFPNYWKCPPHHVVLSLRLQKFTEVRGNRREYFPREIRSHEKMVYRNVVQIFYYPKNGNARNRSYCVERRVWQSRRPCVVARVGENKKKRRIYARGEEGLTPYMWCVAISRYHDPPERPFGECHGICESLPRVFSAGLCW